MIILMIVVLPAPFGPISPYNSPFSISHETSSTATFAPNVFVTCVSWIIYIYCNGMFYEPQAKTLQWVFFRPKKKLLVGRSFPSAEQREDSHLVSHQRWKCAFSFLLVIQSHNRIIKNRIKKKLGEN